MNFTPKPRGMASCTQRMRVLEVSLWDNSTWNFTIKWQSMWSFTLRPRVCEFVSETKRTNFSLIKRYMKFQSKRKRYKNFEMKAKGMQSLSLRSKVHEVSLWGKDTWSFAKTKWYVRFHCKKKGYMKFYSVTNRYVNFHPEQDVHEVLLVLLFGIPYTVFLHTGPELHLDICLNEYF
jgi:hypothetical protein